MFKVYRSSLIERLEKRLADRERDLRDVMHHRDLLRDQLETIWRDERRLTEENRALKAENNALIELVQEWARLDAFEESEESTTEVLH